MVDDEGRARERVPPPSTVEEGARSYKVGSRLSPYSMDVTTAANIAFAGIAVFGAVLTGLAVLAVRRAPSPRMGLVAAGFGLITVQGIAVGVGLFEGGWSLPSLLLLSAALEAALLFVLFIATLIR